MRFASAVSTADTSEAAFADVIASVDQQLEGGALWAMVFASSHHRDLYPTLAGRLSRALGGATVVGSSAEGVIGAGCEVEAAPGLAVVAAHMPGVQVHPFSLDQGGLPESGAGPDVWAEAVGVDPEAARGIVLLPDPFTFDTATLLTGLDATYPGVPVLGGQVSGGARDGGQALFIEHEMRPSGAVGLVFTGDVHVQSVVAQGCRPIGAPMFVTACQGSHIEQLDGVDAIDALRSVYEGLEEADRELFQRQLFLGVQMQDQTEYQQGDFLIRHIHGVPKGKRSLSVAMRPDKFQVVQLHVRDAGTSAADLQQTLRRWAARPESRAPRGALFFQCVGRGVRLYNEPDHDARMFLSELGSVPMGGFFCNGEIGPVHGRTHVHGYTSAIALFS